jgi:hypothetical protein
MENVADLLAAYGTTSELKADEGLTRWGVEN